MRLLEHWNILHVTTDALVTGSGNEKIYSDAAKGLVQ